jgi:hypothetical protein
MPMRTCPLWPQLRPALWEAFKRETDRALEHGVDMRKNVINDTLGLGGKPEFPTYQESDFRVEKVVDGRYDESSAAGKRLKDELVANGMEVYPQPCHGLRDYRANELGRLGYTMAEIDAWVGNSEAVRKLHYAATAINAEDISSALAKEAKRMEMDVDVTANSEDQAVRGTVLHARGTLGARELADVDPVKPAQPVDLASILANASVADLQALVQYAQQDSNLRPTD